MTILSVVDPLPHTVLIDERDRLCASLYSSTTHITLTLILSLTTDERVAMVTVLGGDLRRARH